MLTNKVVMVTGAAGQLGSSFAKAIIRNNGRAVLADTDSTKLNVLGNELCPERTLCVTADATLPDQIDSLIQKSLESFGRLDAAVHTTYPRSGGWGTPFEELRPECLAEDLHKQLGGAILFSQRMIKYFKRSGGGNLIHMSSIQGVTTPKFEHYVGTPMGSPIEYSAIKAGIIAITRYLAKYYKGQRIRVNCISPGGILDDQPATFLEQYRESCTSKGMLDASDLDGALIFLLSDQSSYINGHNIIVDDGWSL